MGQTPGRTPLQRIRVMTIAGGPIAVAIQSESPSMIRAHIPAGVAPAGAALRHWQQMRADSDIQSAPLPPAPPPAPPPDWLNQLLEWLGHLLRALFGPVGRALGLGWPVMARALEGIGVAIGAVVLAVLVWRLFRWLRARHATRCADPDDLAQWSPQGDQARALLDEADRLAHEGRFDEAAHLLLLRSVEHIANARPGWLHPASTAREIASLAALSGHARAAFGKIAALVEQSRFALRALGHPEWLAARAAYADFALQRLDGAASEGVEA